MIIVHITTNETHKDNATDRFTNTSSDNLRDTEKLTQVPITCVTGKVNTSFDNLRDREKLSVFSFSSFSFLPQAEGDSSPTSKLHRLLAESRQMVQNLEQSSTFSLTGSPNQVSYRVTPHHLKKSVMHYSLNKSVMQEIPAIYHSNLIFKLLTLKAPPKFTQGVKLLQTCFNFVVGLLNPLKLTTPWLFNSHGVAYVT